MSRSLRDCNFAAPVHSNPNRRAAMTAESAATPKRERRRPDAGWPEEGRDRHRRRPLHGRRQRRADHRDDEQHPDSGGLRQRYRRPRRLSVRHGHPDAVRNRVRRDGKAHHHSRRLLRFHLPRPRPGMGYGQRRARHVRLCRVRGLADRRLRVFRQRRREHHCGSEHPVVVVRHRRDTGHRGAVSLPHQSDGGDPEHDADMRGARPARARRSR